MKKPRMCASGSDQNLSPSLEVTITSRSVMFM
jgi:hypothetical protein